MGHMIVVRDETLTGLAQPADTERPLNGYRVADRQVEDLDEGFHLDGTHGVVFVRVVAFVGGRVR